MKTEEEGYENFFGLNYCFAFPLLILYKYLHKDLKVICENIDSSPNNKFSQRKFWMFSDGLQLCPPLTELLQF